MWKQARGIVADAVRDFLRSWKSLATTDIGYKVVAFALLTPLTVLLFRWLVFSAHTKVVADADILRFFVTTRVGVVALVVVGAIMLAISAVELACLMAIGLAAAKGTRLSPKHAVVFGATRTPDVLRLTLNVVVRLLAGLLPLPPVVEGHQEPTGGWTNPYDAYMYPIANKITEEFGIDKEGATALVFGVAEKLAEAKNLPPVPKAGEDIPEADFQKWVAAAKAIKFEGFCSKVAERIMQEAVEETAGEPDGG